jgi:hypothetical protein
MDFCFVLDTHPEKYNPDTYSIIGDEFADDSKELIHHEEDVVRRFAVYLNMLKFGKEPTSILYHISKYGNAPPVAEHRKQLAELLSCVRGRNGVIKQTEERQAEWLALGLCSVKKDSELYYRLDEVSLLLKHYVMLLAFSDRCTLFLPETTKSTCCSNVKTSKVLYIVFYLILC